MDITQFNHWGFAEWLNERSKDNPAEQLSVSIHHDEAEDVYYIDIHEESGQCLETFYYMREEEIMHDLAEGNKQFDLKIEMI